ncbi:hypothetical protein V7056_06700 [Bacillus sp. JJ664]
MLETIVFYGVIALIILIGSLLFNKGEKLEEKDKKLSYIFISLAINVYAIPISLFIGGMATDSPDSTMSDFCLGFLFVQGIPLLSLMVSIIYFFYNRKDIKNS